MSKLQFTLPFLRFKEFSGEYVKVKIKNIGDILTGKTPNTKNKDFWNGHIPFITPTDIRTMFTSKTERYLTLEGTKNSKIVPVNSILVTCIASILWVIIESTNKCYNSI